MICSVSLNRLGLPVALEKEIRSRSSFRVQCWSRSCFLRNMYVSQWTRQVLRGQVRSGQSRSMSKARFALSSRYQGLDQNVWLNIFPGSGQTTDFVNLALGFPDYSPAPTVLAHLAAACQPDSAYNNHQYTRIQGHPRLVRALANLYSTLLDRPIDPLKEVLVTPGAAGAMNYALCSHLNPGDEVVIIEPFFDPYAAWVKAAGGSPVYVPLRHQNGSTSAAWTLDMTEFEAAFSQRTKVLILNTPNNPLGKVFSRQELTEIGRVCRKHDVLILTDEVYDWIVYEDKEHVRISTLEDFWNRTITVGSAGKAFSLTGWKLGWAYGPEELIRNLGVAHMCSSFVCQTPEQEAVAVTLESELPLLGTADSFFARLRKELAEKRARIVGALKQSGMTTIVPDGGYFIIANSNSPKLKLDLSAEAAERRDFQFTQWLLREKKLLGVPGSVFFSHENRELGRDWVRFNFYKSEATLQKAAEILGTLN